MVRSAWCSARARGCVFGFARGRYVRARVSFSAISVFRQWPAGAGGDPANGTRPYGRNARNTRRFRDDAENEIHPDDARTRVAVSTREYAMDARVRVRARTADCCYYYCYYYIVGARGRRGRRPAADSRIRRPRGLAATITRVGTRGRRVWPAAGAAESTSIMHSPRTEYQGTRRSTSTPGAGSRGILHATVRGPGARARARATAATVAAFIDARVPGAQRSARSCRRCRRHSRCPENTRRRRSNLNPPEFSRNIPFRAPDSRVRLFIT